MLTYYQLQISDLITPYTIYIFFFFLKLKLESSVWSYRLDPFFLFRFYLFFFFVSYTTFKLSYDKTRPLLSPSLPLIFLFVRMHFFLSHSPLHHTSDIRTNIYAFAREAGRHVSWLKISKVNYRKCTSPNCRREARTTYEWLNFNRCYQFTMVNLHPCVQPFKILPLTMTFEFVVV